MNETFEKIYLAEAQSRIAPLREKKSKVSES
jgi:hypothetical protein